MLLRQLELFILVAESGSISKAATHEYISVAAVSQHIANLEREIGTPLFYRTNHGTQMTSNGELFYQDAKAIVSHAHEAIKHAKERAADIRRLVIGGYGSDTHQILPTVFSAIMKHFPDVHSSVKSIDYHEIENILMSSGIDICFVYGQYKDNARSHLIKYTQLYMDNLCLSVPKNSCLAREKCIRFSDLRNTNLVIIERGFSYLHDRIRDYITSHEKEINLIDCSENYVENTCRIYTTECSYLVPRLFDHAEPDRVLRPVSFAEEIPIGVISRKTIPPFIEKDIIPFCRKVVTELGRSKPDFREKGVYASTEVQFP